MSLVGAGWLGWIGEEDGGGLRGVGFRCLEQVEGRKRREHDGEAGEREGGPPCGGLAEGQDQRDDEIGEQAEAGQLHPGVDVAVDGQGEGHKPKVAGAGRRFYPTKVALWLVGLRSALRLAAREDDGEIVLVDLVEPLVHSEDGGERGSGGEQDHVGPGELRVAGPV